MKKIFFTVAAAMIFLSSCEVEYVSGVRYHHYWGYEHAHHPDHHEVYNHGYHHDANGGEVIEHRK